MPVPGCDQHHDLGLVEEGDVQAGPTGGQRTASRARAAATRVQRGPEAWTVTGLKGSHVHQTTLNSHPAS